MKWDDVGDMACSVARTLSVTGDRWTMLILRDAFSRPVRFEQLQRRFGMTRHVLASRLSRLVEQGVLEQRAYQMRPVRSEYSLTQKGQGLLPVLLAMMAWGDRWMDQGAGPPVIVRHRGCDAIITAACTCPNCGETLTPDRIETLKGPGWGRSHSPEAEASSGSPPTEPPEPRVGQDRIA